MKKIKSSTTSKQIKDGVGLEPPPCSNVLTCKESLETVEGIAGALLGHRLLSNPCLGSTSNRSSIPPT